MSVLSDSPAVQRVRSALAEAGLSAELIELPGAARTAKQAAAFLGCEIAQIANSLVFRGASTRAPLLVMSSGAKRVSLERLANLVGEPVEKADADFVRERTGFAIGGVAPVGHVERLRTYVEASLGEQPEIWAAAGHPHAVFRLTCGELLRITGGTIVQAAA